MDQKESINIQTKLGMPNTLQGSNRSNSFMALFYIIRLYGLTGLTAESGESIFSGLNMNGTSISLHFYIFIVIHIIIFFVYMPIT